MTERRARQRGIDLALVEAVAELVYGREQRLEVVLVIAGGDPDIGGGDAGRERMGRLVEAPVVVSSANSDYPGASLMVYHTPERDMTVVWVFGVDD